MATAIGARRRGRVRRTTRFDRKSALLTVINELSRHGDGRRLGLSPVERDAG